MAIDKVGVVGLGTMGAGIAQLCIEAGVETVARDVTDAAGEKGRARIEAFLDKRVEKGRLDAGVAPRPRHCSRSPPRSVTSPSATS